MGRWDVGTMGRLGADVFVDNDGITDLEVVYYVSWPRVLRLAIPRLGCGNGHRQSAP